MPVNTIKMLRIMLLNITAFTQHKEESSQLTAFRRYTAIRKSGTIGLSAEIFLAI